MTIQSTKEGMYSCSLVHKHYSWIMCNNSCGLGRSTRRPKNQEESNVAMLDYVKNVCACQCNLIMNDILQGSVNLFYKGPCGQYFLC